LMYRGVIIEMTRHFLLDKKIIKKAGTFDKQLVYSLLSDKVTYGHIESSIVGYPDSNTHNFPVLCVIDSYLSHRTEKTLSENIECPFCYFGQSDFGKKEFEDLDCLQFPGTHKESYEILNKLLELIDDNKII